MKFAQVSGMAIMAAAMLGASVAVPTAVASTYPDKPVNLVVPFPPGGAVDLAGRAFGQAMSTVWKEPVVINNRPGAGGAIGMTSVANAQPDGYTLLLTHPALHALPEADKLFGRQSNYNPDDLKPLALLVADPLVFLVRADSPWQTYQEFVEYARANPEEVTYSSSGPYSAVHLPIEMLAHAADIRLQHISYSGGGPALNALLGGHVHATTPVPAVAAPHVESGALRALVITGAERHPSFPDVPTAMELGYSDVEFYLWVGLFAPAATPEATVDIIQRDVAKAMEGGSFQKTLSAAGSVVDYRDAEAFEEFLERDTNNIRQAIQRIGKVE